MNFRMTGKYKNFPYSNNFYSNFNTKYSALLHRKHYI